MHDDKSFMVENQEKIIFTLSIASPACFWMSKLPRIPKEEPNQVGSRTPVKVYA